MRYFFLMTLVLVSLQAKCDISLAGTNVAVEKYAEAKALYLECTDEENSEAAYRLGRMYENGEGVEANPKEALEWYKKAARWDLAGGDKESVYETIYRNLDPLDDEESTKTLIQLANGKFGLRSYYPNYAVVSYTSTNPDGDDAFENSDVNPHYINTETKYQISVRADYTSTLFGFAQVWTGAYTQTSYWQIFIASAPFRETNYKPEAFVTIPLFHKADIIGLKAFSLGYKHSSNGQPDSNGTRVRPDGPRVGSRSRSWNRAYARGYFQWGNVFSEITTWYRFKEKFEDNDNPDLQDYYGQGSIELGYIHKKLLARITMRPSFTMGHLSAELEMSYPVPVSDNVLFFMQAFSGFDTHGNYGGYGQSLIDYDVATHQVGFGLSISR